MTSKPRNAAAAAEPPAPIARPATLHAEQPLCHNVPDHAPHPLDMAMQNGIARFTGGISPASVGLAWMDWALNFAVTPSKSLELGKLLQQQTLAKAATLKACAEGKPPAAPAATSDSRFAHAGWQQWPFNMLRQNFLNAEEFWQHATSDIPGVTEHHANVVNFMARQLLDTVAPSNFPWCNPEVIETTVNQQGKNLWSGYLHWLQDLGLELPHHSSSGSQQDDQEQHAEPAFLPGRDVATSKGEVVFRNHLIELLQYQPTTSEVRAEPLLIVPSWIMKYYILDLSPHNSMVSYLLSQGYTVFMVSWKNPTAEDRQLGMNDYLNDGLYAAVSKITELTRGAPLHTAGYCLGGTLLAIGMAAFAGQQAVRQQTGAQIASVTLLAAQTDFSEPGELGLFIDESQLAMLDAMMWKQGYLDGQQMAGSFQLLNARDLIWSKIMRDYQLGQRTDANDLMSWNADTTRMPYRMHSEYLRHLFLHNDLAKGHYEVNGQAVALKDIKLPMYVVGTARDHVSPWKSVYKINVLTDTELEFVLASGGHNAGIVSEPGHARRSYQLSGELGVDDNYAEPDIWLSNSRSVSGSWWEHWSAWLQRHSGSQMVKARIPAHDAELGSAPGSYVFQM